MARIGYARVSITDPDLAIQLAALKAAGCDPIREEKASGSSTTGRTELSIVLDFIGSGDTRIDRLARSVSDLQDIVRTLKVRGATLQATEQPIDTGTAAGKAFLDILGGFAELETNMRCERQMMGIAKAKAVGIYKGRWPSIDTAQVCALNAGGMVPSDIARASVYRTLKQKTAPWPCELRAR